jgi:hypothetical protein
MKGPWRWAGDHARGRNTLGVCARNRAAQLCTRKIGDRLTDGSGSATPAAVVATRTRIFGRRDIVALEAATDRHMRVVTNLIQIKVGPGRAAAEQKGSRDFTPLWSGQAAALSREMPAAILMQITVKETLERLHRLRCN